MAPAAIITLSLMIYTGFAIPTINMHPWFRWINYINPVAYGFEALMINEVRMECYQIEGAVNHQNNWCLKKSLPFQSIPIKGIADGGSSTTEALNVRHSSLLVQDTRTLARFKEYVLLPGLQQAQTLSMEILISM